MMKKILLFTVLLVICAKLFGQEKSNNNDLRRKKEIFTIKEVAKGKGAEYKLEASVSGQFNMRIVDIKKTLYINKVDSDDAQKMDDEFVDKFISFKYIMKARANTKCENSYFLSLRGESLVICSDEKDKIKIIKLIIKNIKNKFS